MHEFFYVLWRHQVFETLTWYFRKFSDLKIVKCKFGNVYLREIYQLFLSSVILEHKKINILPRESLFSVIYFAQISTFTGGPYKLQLKSTSQQFKDALQVFALSLKRPLFPSSISCHATSGYVKLICSWHLFSSCDAVFVLSIGNERGIERKKYKGNEISELSRTSMLLFKYNVKIVDSYPQTKLIWASLSFELLSGGFYYTWVQVLIKALFLGCSWTFKNYWFIDLWNISPILVYMHFILQFWFQLKVWLDTIYKYQVKWIFFKGRVGS